MDKEKEIPAASAENTVAPQKSRKTLLRRIFAGVVVALIALVIFLWLLLDWTVAATVRNVAPVFTGTPVELKGVSIGILRGRVELEGFKVGNPKGFNRPYAFELDSFVCQVQIPSLLSDKIMVDEVSIHGMLADYEVGLEGSNLALIQKNVESVIGKADAVSAQPADDDGEEEKPAKKVVIRKLSVDGVSLALAAVRIPLPPIVLNDLGDGKRLTEVVNEFYAALMKSVADAVSSQVVQGVGNAAKGVGNAASDAAKGVSNAASDAAKGVSNAASEAAKGVSNAASEAGKNAVDAVTNIFKKK
ncbi:MAG: hypothetical protein IJC34_08360 [Lentisphaeria bacterium]|nr:hypothetical protein [Lentisphaeria bacterium]